MDGSAYINNDCMETALRKVKKEVHRDRKTDLEKYSETVKSLEDENQMLWSTVDEFKKKCKAMFA